MMQDQLADELLTNRLERINIRRLLLQHR